jgi:hypothetical protein
MPIASAISETKLQRLERQGKLFYISTVLPAQSATVEFLWRVGAKPLSFTAAFSSTLKTTYTIREAPAVTATGTQGALLNRNRNFTDNGLLFKRYTAPNYTGGTIISVDQTGASAAPGQSTQAPAVTADSTLDANTDYIITIAPSASNDISIDVLWWED